MPRARPVRTALAAAAAVGLSCSLLATAAPAAAGPPPDPVPTGKLTMTGDVGDFVPGVVDDPVHDPTIFRDGETFYVFSTGALDPDDPGGIHARRSTGGPGGPWESLGAVPLPEWTLDYDIGHLWAPHVVEQRGFFYLYYSASSFGSNTSAIGVARTRTPGDLDSWRDLGPVLTSGPGDDYNAIDPMVFQDDDGRWAMAFGSFWSGIKVVQLAGMRHPRGEIRSLASRPQVEANPIENPQIFRHGDWWYLMTSWDFCCRGVDSTYRTAVGRSSSPYGPFVDSRGVPLLEGGGDVVLSRRGNQVGMGAPDVVEAYDRWYLVHHYYDADADGVIRMQVREVEWRDGWPFFSYGPGDGTPPS